VRRTVAERVWGKIHSVHQWAYLAEWFVVPATVIGTCGGQYGVWCGVC